MSPDQYEPSTAPTPVSVQHASSPHVLHYQPRPAEDQVGAGGGFRLFRVFGITVFLHWSWFLVAIYQIQRGGGGSALLGWNIAVYLALFSIVLLHEFGHALACRSVGGQANRILLWPFGGIAYVSPPPRPGAVLWSIAAGPLVNVALIPVTYALAKAGADWGWNLQYFTATIYGINILLLKFNLLPIYPLDGGQILQSLLWFVMGRARSLLVAASIGILGAIGCVIYVFKYLEGDTWLMIMAVFAITMAWNGVKTARKMLEYERAVEQHHATMRIVQ